MTRRIPYFRKFSMIIIENLLMNQTTISVSNLELTNGSTTSTFAIGAFQGCGVQYCTGNYNSGLSIAACALANAWVGSRTYLVNATTAIFGLGVMDYNQEYDTEKGSTQGYIRDTNTTLYNSSGQEPETTHFLAPMLIFPKNSYTLIPNTTGDRKYDRCSTLRINI